MTQATYSTKYPTSFAQEEMDLGVARDSLGELVGMEVAQALFAPVLETLVSEEEAMYAAMYERLGGDEAVAKGWVWQTSGFGTD